ncbi:hypothetical protein [Streptomyces prasinus]|uniref:hypothetical protein n=1 Tax=Streptomyces prasinus TaxID=67345 RepID=UPI0006EBB467
MTMPVDLETDAARLRGAMAEDLAARGCLDDAAWRAAVEAVPLCVHDGGQHLWHPRLPCLSLPSS